MEVSLEQELQIHLQLLNEERKQSVLAMIKSFFTVGKSAERMSIKAYNAELDRAVAEVRAGQYISQEELERQEPLLH